MIPGLTPFTLVLSFYILSVGWLYKTSTQLTTSLPSIARALSDGPNDPSRRSEHTHPDTHTCKAQTSSVAFVYRGSGGIAVKGATPSRAKGRSVCCFGSDHVRFFLSTLQHIRRPQAYPGNASIDYAFTYGEGK